MLQIKIFSNASDNYVERSVNTWIAEHPDYFIKDVKLSETYSPGADEIFLTAMVIYQTNTLGVADNG